MVLIGMNIVYCLAAYPAGWISDRGSRRKVLIAGVGFLLAADLILGLASNLWMLALGIA